MKLRKAMFILFPEALEQIYRANFERLYGPSPAPLDREAALAECDGQVMIPMMGMTQSLNVSVACAIVLYEALRQRDRAGLYGSSRLDDVTVRRQRFEWLHPVVARFCRERGLDYPELNAEGDIVGSFPRGAA